MVNKQREIVYEYTCRSCSEKITAAIPDYHLNNRCMFCGDSLFAPLMFFEKRYKEPDRVQHSLPRQ